jgi:hypothetical protein
MTSGERRFAERIEQKLDADYLAWYDVPVGPTNAHPDFVILHPRRGLLILEVKDWRLDTIQQASKQTWDIAPDGVPKTVVSPLEQARHYAHQVVNALQRDTQLVQAEGPHKGKVCFPWSYGVVLSRITRKQFEDSGLGEAVEPHRVICQDEMTENADAEAFQPQLWGMFPTAMRGALTLPQIDRIRWILFPELRISPQLGLFGSESAEGELPDLMRVMDLQQEQLARSLGEGHRVIHGVAGSGKTLILGYRAEQLAQSATNKPILILCYNEPLAVKLEAVIAAKGLADRVLVRNFHRWCRQLLVLFGQAVPQGQGMFEQMIEDVIRGVEHGQIPGGQYHAILIDEGHDFQPAWLKLVTQMVDPNTNSLLLLYDDAQSIYERGRSKQFSFKSVGIQAQGRTTILKINYRNPKQILRTASYIAAELLRGEDTNDDDGVPRVHPISSGREGQIPLIIRLPSLREEAAKVAELLAAAHQQGHGWGDMAVLCRYHHEIDQCAAALQRRRLPHQVRRTSGSYDPRADTIKVMTMHVSKGLEFPVVALVGVGAMPGQNEDESEEARLFYVAATRATHALYVTLSGQGEFAKRLPSTTHRRTGLDLS